MGKGPDEATLEGMATLNANANENRSMMNSIKPSMSSLAAATTPRTREHRVSEQQRSSGAATANEYERTLQTIQCGGVAGAASTRVTPMGGGASHRILEQLTAGDAATENDYTARVPLAGEPGQQRALNRQAFADGSQNSLSGRLQQTMPVKNASAIGQQP